MKCNLTIHNKQKIFLGYKINFSHNKFTVKIPNSRSRYYLVGHSTTTKIINSLIFSEANPNQIRHYVKLLNLSERFYL